MFEMLLGHLVGDYLLQNQWMALNKSKNTIIGWISALIHCILYTIAVCLIMWNFDLIWIVVVFLSHFPIDKFGLAEFYLNKIKNTGLKKYVHKDQWKSELKYSAAPESKLNRFDALEGGFAAFVYGVTDNTLHLLIMWLAYQIIY